MKTILVPTDFSEAAENALHLSMLIARQQSAKLILAHIYAVPAPVSDLSYEVIFEQENSTRNAAIGKIKALCGQVRHMGGVEYEYVVEGGTFVDAMLKICKEKEADFVVMGTKGINSVGDRLFGTHSTQLMAKASCPVMVVPVSARFGRPIKKIVYATQYLETDFENLLQLAAFASPINAQITILHISQEETSPEKGTAVLGDFIRRTERSLSYNKFTYQLLFGGDVEDKLEEYLGSTNADMIVMSTGQRTLLKRLFGKSLTRKTILHSHVPVLAFHHAAVHENIA